MLTFQILDGGETLYWPLDGRTVVVGHGSAADVRLRADGVDEEHARIELLTVPGEPGREAYRLLDLDSRTGVRVNGERIAQVRLRLGDRVEIGGAVLVLGKRVSRRATADDVLRDRLPTTASPRSARCRRPSTRRTPTPTFAIALVVALVAVPAMLWLLTRSDAPPAGPWDAQANLRRSGDFDQAGAVLARLKKDWAGNDRDRDAVLASALRELRATQAATDQLRRQILDDAAERTFAEHVTLLKRLTAQGPAAEAEAARIVHRQLSALRSEGREIHRAQLAAVYADELEPAPAETDAPDTATPAPDRLAAAEPPPATPSVEPVPAPSAARTEEHATDAAGDARRVAVRPDDDKLAAAGSSDPGSPGPASPGPAVAAPHLDPGATADAERVEAARRETAALLAAALRDGSSPTEFTRDIVGSDPTASAAAATVLAAERARVADRIARHAFKRTHDRLAARRDKLDAARTHAVALIYDEQRYFFPYRPPAVDASEVKVYEKVQKEVDRRVDAVRRLWQSAAVLAEVPADLIELRRTYRWITQALADIADAEDPTIAARVDWALALPAGGPVMLQNFARTASEREQFELWETILAFNAEHADRIGMTAAERIQGELTNGYRRMFAHPPLALNAKIQAAARKHCEEMTELGYFGHYSPTPGHRTPLDRMAKAGYVWGASENCAVSASASEAHARWVSSSGHHRNLLEREHTEFGVGNVGRYWTQNFGDGDEYLQLLPRGK